MVEFGRVLYLCADPSRVERQLAGERLAVDERAPLADNVSTDEMAPAWACYYYDERLGEYCLVGFRGGAVAPGAVRRGGFSVLVGGAAFGCGSSRETAPFAQRTAGIRLVVAQSFERIYRQNCSNLGIYTSTDFSLLERIEAGVGLEATELVAELDPLARLVVEAGGLGAYGRERLAGRHRASTVARASRGSTLAEKILAAHWVRSDQAEPGVAAVAPGDVGFVRADVRFSHDYVTAMIDAQLRAAFGDEARVSEPQSVFVFRDHLTLLDRVMPDQHRRLGLLERAHELADVQREFAARHGLTLFERTASGGNEGICHNLVIERLALPGQVVVGTDSHTCMAGVMGCLAFGVGSTDMAAGLVTRDFRVTVPESVRVTLKGRLRPGVCAKDAWLQLLSQERLREGLFRGRVIELGGDGYYALPLDERATFTNMAAEAGAFTAIAAADPLVFEFLAAERGGVPAGLRERAPTSDPDAHYAQELELDLALVEAMVALPGDPKNGVPLRELLARGTSDVRIDIAYGGSCTGGKRADMDMYAAVLSAALARGERVAPGVELFLQFGSNRIRHYAEQRGYTALFEAVGAQLLEPSCGACIRAGPGVSTRPEQVSVSATNRNFPGRSGPGQVYLASPLVVAASAVRGRLASPAEFLGAAGLERVQEQT
jgi:3-isopropylmalate/(R)-2-methylmalate dehydratase large subunit